MSQQITPPAPPGTPVEGKRGAESLRPGWAWRWVRGAATSRLGRLLMLAIGLRVVAGGAAPGWLRTLDVAATVVIVVVCGYLLIQAVRRLSRRLLWRVRRRLVLSYLLIGFVPIVLIVSFFLVAGVVLLGTVSASLVRLGFEDVADDAAGLAAITAADLEGLDGPGGVGALLERRRRVVQARYPLASITVVAGTDGDAGLAAAGGIAGPWRHTTAPPVFPVWLGRAGGGLVLTGPAGRLGIVARGTELTAVAGRVSAVVADLPIDDIVVARLQASSGVQLIEVVTALGAAGAEETGLAGPVERVVLNPDRGALAAGAGLPWLGVFDLLDWSTGGGGRAAVTFRVDPRLFYGRVVRGGEFSVRDPFLIGLLAIGVMFLTIEVVALGMGFALARSITGAVHALSTGTERVRRGDFAHRIAVRTHDQLGELAGSFNAMTGSVGELLQQAAEQRRLAEELRIARKIQMSLLPAEPVALPGLAVATLCHPAREVGGDYYDFVPLGEHRLGVLVADVSGKGTSAAFYMAELKGMILSLGQIYRSPKRLLIEVNRILSASLDNRTFITMTYAVVDLEARTLVYARAGHTPMIYLPGDGAAPGRAQVLTPDGLVVGLHIDGFEERFADLLEERTLPIGAGDLFVLFTDGITEAMNAASDLFGEERLCRLVEAHAHLPLEALRARIVGDVEAFVDGADQHDDMTMVLVRLDASPPPSDQAGGGA